ncbi:MAG: hypothetical protein IPK81_13970 [Rhodospirillales bacterium]|nr:MAG: hypothetical protein IPK81_13970 [Rhodospirillales bacterium]
MSAQGRPDVVDTAGRPIALGRLVGRGGEGAVYEIASDANAVAKIYHQPLAPDRAEKIRAMAALRTDNLDKLAAWPLGLVKRRTGEAVGLTMPRVVGHRDIHHLYSPKSRRTDFQKANWQFLIRAATNAARAFATIHASGCVIGDVNPGGVMVAQDARVRLIDCDSFQIQANGRSFLCRVGVPHFTPPELQDKDLSKVVRTANHDNFGLAVMVFLILFMGRHPYAGRYLGAGDMPIEKAISEHRFVYGAGRAAAQMQPPPGTPALDIASAEVARLFERAFARGATAGGRPTATEWVEALAALERRLKACSRNPSHVHFSGLGDCPWCAMEAATGISLFPLVYSATGGGALSIDELLKQFLAVPSPGPAPAVEAAITPSMFTPSPEAVKLREARRWRIPYALGAAAVPAFMVFAVTGGGAKFALCVAAVALYFFVYAMTNPESRVRAFQTRRDAAHQTWTRVSDDWRERAGTRQFDEKRQVAANLRAEWEAVPRLRQRKLDDLRSSARERQLERFLDQFEIPSKGISGIGPARKTLLESYGIETAADVLEHRLLGVPGFGPTRSSALVRWRQGLERRFVFDERRAVEPQDVQRVEQEILALRQSLIARAQRAIQELKVVSAQTMSARSYIWPHLEAAYREYLQADVDLADARKG